MKSEKICASADASFDAGVASGSLSVEGCKENESSSKSGSKNKSDSTKVIAIGSKLSKDGEGEKTLSSTHFCYGSRT